MKWLLRAVLMLLAALMVLAAAWAWQLNYLDGVAIDEPRPEPGAHDTAALRERGAYLAQAGNCMACHTAQGGKAWTGGRPFNTPFGTIYSGNITPDPDTGLGRWSAAAFWRALHFGRSLDGHLLYPAFPYTHFTRITRDDSDALYAYLRGLPAVHADSPPHELRWPYSTQGALAVWRALYFRPGSFAPDPRQSADWNRGAYLVQGPGHCSACHAPRDSLGGADWMDFSGGMIPAQGWYAPSLVDPREAATTADARAATARLLATGLTDNAVVTGPMAEVVFTSAQHLKAADLKAMSDYLATLPATATARGGAQAAERAAGPPQPALEQIGSLSRQGAKLYEQHCADCHGADGRGVPSAYPALAGNRAVTLPRLENLMQAVLYGGFAPATARNPRPFGMPPFVMTLSNAEIAAVLSYIRGAWGNRAPEASLLQVHSARQQIRMDYTQ